MSSSDIWWEAVFEGHLAHGFDKERYEELEQESFLYFDMEQEGELVEHMQ